MRDSSTALSDDVKFECSQCGQRIVVERSAVGVTLDCPGCRHPVTVPPADGIEEAVEVASPSATEAPPEPVAGHADSSMTLGVELEQTRAEAVRQHALFKKAIDECERLKANATHVQAELKSFQADRQQLKADLAQARQAAAAAEGRATEIIVALTAAQEENANLREQMEAESNGLQVRLASQDEAIHERESQLSQALRNLGKAKSDLSASIIEAGGLRSELEAHQHGLQATGQQLSVTKTELRDAITRLGTLTEEHQTASQQRDEWKQRAEGFERDLSAIDNGRDLLELRERHKQLQQDHDALQAKLADQTEQAEKNSNALKGIVARQNTTLGVYHSELRRLRRARFGARLVYGIFFLALVVLAIFAVKIFAPAHMTELLKSIKHLKGGGF